MDVWNLLKLSVFVLVEVKISEYVVVAMKQDIDIVVALEYDEHYHWMLDPVQYRVNVSLFEQNEPKIRYLK